MSRIEAIRHSVEHDLLFRWGVECLVALGLQFDHALTISQVVVRSCERKGSTQPIHTLTSELGRIRDGSFPKTPNHEFNQLSENLLSAQIRNGHPVLALHDAVEFARHAAVLHGWGVVTVHGADSVDATDTYLADNAREGVAGLALMAGTAGWGAVRIRAAFPNGEGAAELFDVPVLLLARAETLGAVSEVPSTAGLFSEFLGMPAAISEEFSRVRPRCVQLLAVDAEHFGPSISRFRVNLQHHGLVGCTSKSIVHATSVKRALHVNHELRSRMQLWSRELGVFDPFA